MLPREVVNIFAVRSGIRTSFTAGNLLIEIVSLLFFFALFVLSVPAYSAVFNISSGDVTGLIAAINAANANGEENTINLARGTYTLTAVDNIRGPGLNNGLPVISGTTTITGESADTTIIARDGAAPRFRIIEVAGSGRLTMDGIAIRGGSNTAGACAGGGINNNGTVTIHRSIIEGNSCSVGGGINNGGILALSQTHVRQNDALEGGGIRNMGTATIIDSSIVQNRGDSGGGFKNGQQGCSPLLCSGTATIRNSTISDNHVIGFFGGVWNDQGVMTITNSTIANNSDQFGGVTVFNGNGTLSITNSTISGNRFNLPGGTTVLGAGIIIQNSIIALNDNSRDCPITSLGNNLFGNPTGCGAPLHPTDLTGDPGLGAFIDDGAPGHGRFPLLATSPAIDRGNNEVCSSDPALTTDQLGTPRRGSCDIGAIEFYPVVNDLMAVGSLSTAFDATPMPGGPAGTFRITAAFTNTSNQAIVNPFVEVVELTGGNLLLNADGGAGGVGARLKPTDLTILQPRVTSTFQFLIGLHTQSRSRFL